MQTLRSEKFDPPHTFIQAKTKERQFEGLKREKLH